MYNGNGNGGYTGGSGSVGGFGLKPVYLYVIMGLLILAAIYIVMRFLNTHAIMHFGLVAGVLLLIANLRELIGRPATSGSLPLLNSLIGGALVCAWISQIVSVFFWIPAILLIGVATPLTLGRASVYSMYIQTAKSAVSSVRRVTGR